MAGPIRANDTRAFYVAKTILEAGTSVLAPLALDRTLRHEPNVSEAERNIIVFQEALRQVSSFVVDTATFVGGGVMTNVILKNHPNKAMLGLINGLIMEKVLGKLVIRPYLISKLTNWWHQHHPTPQLSNTHDPQAGCSPLVGSPLRNVPSSPMPAASLSPFTLSPQELMLKTPKTTNVTP